MPEEVPSLAAQPTPQSQVTPAPKPHNWKKVILTVVFIVVVATVVVGIYWFMVINKSSDDSDLTGPVPKATTKTATESAKEATKSAEKEMVKIGETTVDGIYTDSKLKFQIKIPSSWKIEFEDYYGFREVNIFKGLKGNNTITIMVGGPIGIGSEGILKTETFKIGSNDLDFIYYQYSDKQMSYASVTGLDTSYSEHGLWFWIILDKKTISSELPEVKKILATFKFLD